MALKGPHEVRPLMPVVRCVKNGGQIEKIRNDVALD